MSKIDKHSWDDRFSAADYVYGTEPNSFFKEQLDKLNPGRLLMLAEGEGRNAVYSAKMNWQVDAVDFSSQARIKALKLAANEKVNINYSLSDLTLYQPTGNLYDAVGIIFFHFERPEIEKIFASAKKALKKDGIIICEVFSKNQLGKTSGGPQVPDLLFTTDEIVELFHGLKSIILEERNVLLNEGILHQGEASVINYVGKK
ncbi:MAG: class I SAM-dependent methyltransferase [Ignavibacteriaceae bacterium]|nr:class I SAM-dependent methyltransferase [Ignavibacteriaceae bacterium]